MAQEWVTAKDAAKLRKCSERNIIELIKKGELDAKKDGRRWLILMDASEMLSEEMPQASEIISLLKVQLQEKDDQIRNLQQQVEETRKDSVEANQRHDTIVLQLTRHLEHEQKLLEYHQEPFYRRWFMRKRETERG